MTFLLKEVLFCFFFQIPDKNLGKNDHMLIFYPPLPQINVGMITKCDLLRPDFSPSVTALNQGERGLQIT